MSEDGKKTRENGKGKGLGWIPEHPDLRDYDLGNEETLRFKIEEKIAREEKIAEDLILLIESLNYEDKGVGSQGDNKERQSQINDFKNEVLSNINFIKVKVHKIFRYPSLQEEKSINQLPDNNSLFIQQILELKRYLSIMVMTNQYLKCEYKKFYEKRHKQIEDAGYKITNFDDDKEVLNWMREKDYDITAIKLVTLLQNYFKIENDGIFGLKTYTSLGKYFSGKYTLPNEINNECNNSNLSLNQKSPPKIQFIHTDSFISSIALDKILDILIDVTIESIYNEYTKPSDKSEKIYNKICEYDFLEKFKIVERKEDKDFFKRYLREDLEEIINLIEKHHKNKGLEYIIDIIEELNHLGKNNENKSEENEEINKCDAIKNKVSDSFWSYIKNNDKESSLRYEEIIKALRYSYVIEPIISSILNILSPLGKPNNQSLEELIEQGFKKFENILSPEKFQDYNDDLQIFEAAVEKVLSLLKMEIKSLLGKTEDWIRRNKYQYSSHIFLCFLITKYIKKFSFSQIQKCEKINKRNINKPNIFDKQELFEIDYRADLGQQDSELFPTLEITIPVVGNDIIQQFKSNLRDEGKKQLYSFLPGVVDLSYWFPPVRDQGSLYSCTAFAATSLFEYFVNKNLNKNVDASPLFLYKAARNKMNLTEDVGASIRETMKALALYGVPPETAWILR